MFHFKDIFAREAPSDVFDENTEVFSGFSEEALTLPYKLSKVKKFGELCDLPFPLKIAPLPDPDRIILDGGLIKERGLLSFGYLKTDSDLADNFSNPGFVPFRSPVCIDGRVKPLIENLRLLKHHAEAVIAYNNDRTNPPKTWEMAYQAIVSSKSFFAQDLHMDDERNDGRMAETSVQYMAVPKNHKSTETVPHKAVREILQETGLSGILEEDIQSPNLENAFKWNWGKLNGKFKAAAVPLTKGWMNAITTNTFHRRPAQTASGRPLILAFMNVK